MTRVLVVWEDAYCESLGALVKHDLVMREGPRYVVIDSLLREWVARKTY